MRTYRRFFFVVACANNTGGWGTQGSMTAILFFPRAFVDFIAIITDIVGQHRGVGCSLKLAILIWVPAFFVGTVVVVAYTRV